MRAPAGKVIVIFHHYRREGRIVVPDRYAPQPVECTVISDSKDGELEGETAIASLLDGTYFTHEHIEYCVLKRKSIIMLYTEKDGKIDTVRPSGRAVLVEDRGRVEKVGDFYMPENDNRFPPIGKVLATGPGDWDFAEGDVVHFDRSKAVVIGIDGKRALFVCEKDIYAKEEQAA